jgi:hypothetical protein
MRSTRSNSLLNKQHERDTFERQQSDLKQAPGAGDMNHALRMDRAGLATLMEALCD